jgi:hypothetical protein
MSPILLRFALSRRTRRRIHLPALAFGCCALLYLSAPSVLGQARLGAAESCFDQGPDKIPATPSAAIPALRTPLPEQALLTPRLRPASLTTGRPTRLQQDDLRLAGRVPQKPAPAINTLTAAR